MEKDIEEFYTKREHLENALNKWLAQVEEVKADIIQLIEHYNVPKSKISKDIDKMKIKLISVQNNLKTY